MNKDTIFHTYEGYSIAIHRFHQGKSIYPPILLIHGSIENGKIFYSSSGKGFAPFLAQNGFDIFVADLRGKGSSKPSVSSNSKVSQTNTIMGEIPSLVNKVKEITGSDAIHFGAHSWGGVLLLSAYALFHQEWNVKSMIFFGTKRRIGIKTFEKFMKIDVGWNLLGSIYTRIYGYLPAKKIKMGSDDEPAKLYFQINKWIYTKDWIDPETKFDYGKKLKSIHLPPIHSFTGSNDKLLGHPDDVKRLVTEAGCPDALQIIGKQNGNLQDYDHINILTHPDALKDHFVEVVRLYKSYS